MTSAETLARLQRRGARPNPKYGKPTLGASAGLTRLDVVVEAEKIRRIVFILQGDEAIVIEPVSFTGDGIALVSDVIAIRACNQERP